MVMHPLPKTKKTKNIKKIKSMLRSFGITDLNKLRTVLEKTKWWVFAEDSFCHPDDVDEKLVLAQWQKSALTKIQFIFYNGYLKEVKRYLQIIAPRSRGKSVLIGVANAIIVIVSGGAMTGVFSPSMQQSENLMSKTKFFIEHSKYGHWILPRGKHISGMTKIFTGAQSVGMTNRSFSQAWANNEKTMRGIHLKAAFIDESARMDSHTLKAAIYPMVRRSKGPLICITTPFGKSGPAWEAFTDTSGTWETIMIPAIDEDFMTQEELDRQLAAYGDDQQLAAQELLADFISDDNAIYKNEWFSHFYKDGHRNQSVKGIKMEYDHTKRYHVSADYGWHSNRSVVMVGFEEEQIIKDKTKIIVKIVYIKSWLNGDPEVIENKLLELFSFYNVALFMPDGRSVGSGELKRLYKRMKREKIKTKMYKTGDPPKRNQIDKRKLGLITTTGYGDHSKLNIVNESVRRSNINEVRLPIDALLFKKTKEDEIRRAKDECYMLERQLQAFRKEVTKAGNVVFGKQASTDKKFMDDHAVTFQYMIFSFSKLVKTNKLWGVGFVNANDSKSISDNSPRNNNTEVGYYYGSENRRNRREDTKKRIWGT